MRSVAALKIGYAALAVLFSWMLARLLLAVTAARADPGRTAWAAALLGAAGAAVAWTGWVLARRLGLSPSNAAAVAMGSVMGGVNVAVLAWLMLTHAPGDRPPA